MAESRRYCSNSQLDLEQILLEAQSRWLRPTEICEILRNYQRFHIAAEPPNKPPSGSLFLFDRKVLRYFRKDGHNWRKKRDGKTVKEAHERLKAGSIDVLHCYYAHGEDDENFQRRSYWMLEEDLMHIVLVHYLEVKGNKASSNRIRDNEESSQNSQFSPFYSNYMNDHNQVSSADTSSMNSIPTSEYEDVESADTQVNSGHHSFLGLQATSDMSFPNQITSSSTYLPVPCQNEPLQKQSIISELHFVPPPQQHNLINDAEFNPTFSEVKKQIDPIPWDKMLENSNIKFPSPMVHASLSSDFPLDVGPKPETSTFEQLLSDEIGIRQRIIASGVQHTPWEIPSEDQFLGVSKWPVDKKLSAASTFDRNLGIGSLDTENYLTIEGNGHDPSSIKDSLNCIKGEEGLKKYDSFTRWMSKELEEVDDSCMQMKTGSYWPTDENGDVVDDSSLSHQEDAYLMSPSLSHVQLFSIIDFSPTWAYTNEETKILITGIFLKGKADAEECKWSCMFGEVEVPVEVLTDGVLRCHAPSHEAGRVPFYITCSNRLACSEIREFEYRVSNTRHGNEEEMLRRVRLSKLLCQSTLDSSLLSFDNICENPQVRNKLSSLVKDNNDEWIQMFKCITDKEYSIDKIEEQLFQMILKVRFHDWLLEKVVEDGKGPNVLDKDGQGVIHLGASLGYDWVIAPIVVAGVNINYRDVHGWTALHWAASCGRERTVGVLVSLGGAPGAITDPTPMFPSGRTAADLASANGHKGIAGYLAESSLTSHLSSLNLKGGADNENTLDSSGVKAVQTFTERNPTQPTDGYIPQGLSLKDSLSAICNATQAAARIHQVFRVQSFQRKQITESGNGNFESSDHALSLLSRRQHKTGQHDEPIHKAAIRIQNKFRGWKGRKEFLLTRQQIVKIQAHYRGHRVRKQYKTIIWSVGIVEKAILRWRRKGSGLRGFRSEGLIENKSIDPSKEDDYDFLKEGRKQTEIRLEKALARVKSMVQYPEARDQYRRLLAVVTECNEKKVLENVLNESGEAEEDDYGDTIDIEALLDDDDIFMSTGS